MKTNNPAEFVEQMKLVKEIAANATTIFNQHLVGKSGKDMVVAVCALSTALGTYLKDMPTLVAQEMAETLCEFTGGTIKAMAHKLAKEQSDDTNNKSDDTNKQAKSE